jgi:hypothetical protein
MSQSAGNFFSGDVEYIAQAFQPFAYLLYLLVHIDIKN